MALRALQQLLAALPASEAAAATRALLTDAALGALACRDFAEVNRLCAPMLDSVLGAVRGPLVAQLRAALVEALAQADAWAAAGRVGQLDMEAVRAASDAATPPPPPPAQRPSPVRPACLR